VSDLVVVDVVPTEMEAEIVCSFLQSEGIPAMQRQTTMGGGAADGMPIGGAREILVRADQLERAREALESQQREND
jgi:Putative prokaryotic signal transducing protein